MQCFRSNCLSAPAILFYSVEHLVGLGFSGNPVTGGCVAAAAVMEITCLSKGRGFSVPPCHILEVSGCRILLDCPLDLSALTIFSPIPPHSYPLLDEEETSDGEHDSNSLSESRKRQKLENPVDAKDLIFAEPWYKTPKNLHLWDPSCIDVVLISSTMGILGLPFLTRSQGFSAKIYVTEATARIGQLMLDDLVSMHTEFRQFYGCEECGGSSPQWMKWDELDLLPPVIQDVVLGKDGSELGGWMPLYSSADVKDCMQKIQTLKYAEAACYNGMLVVKPLSSGCQIGSCNWSISSPNGNIATFSSSIFGSAVAMEFDYASLKGTDLLFYSDFSFQNAGEEVGPDNYNSAPITNNWSTLSAEEDDQTELKEFVASDEGSEREKLAFICSCITDSIKAGGSVLLPLNQLEIVLQLLELITVSLESSSLKVPMYVISSVAEELLSLSNTIPEWLCKQRQEKLFSGEPLFLHVELMKEKKLHVFPAVHSPDLLTNWQEPCIVFSPHWSLRLGPAVHMLRRWHEDQNSLLILEDELNADIAFLPFQPMKMKVLRCSFFAGVRVYAAQHLLKLWQPKAVLVPEDLRQQMNFPNSSLHPCSFFYYTENETLRIPSRKDELDLEIESDLATQFSWKKLKEGEMEIARLDGQLLIDKGKYRLLSEKKVTHSLEGRPFLQWGSPDTEKLLAVLSNMGIEGSVEQGKDDAESGSASIVHVHHPAKALIEFRATSTVICAPNKDLAASISEAVGALLNGI